jgi:ketosteroid isomerase-like protein
MENAADNELLIRQIVENWAKAVRDENMNGILAHHADDIIMFDVPEPFQSIGIDAYRKTWDIFFKYTRPGVFDIQTLKVIAAENVAFCIATMKCLDKGDGVILSH